MGETVYKIIELVGTSTESWEKAAAAAVETAAKSLKDLRIAEVVQLDMQLENGKVAAPTAPRSRCPLNTVRNKAELEIPIFNFRLVNS